VNSYRFWSPAAVLAQIDTLVTKHGVRNLKIADEMFVLNRRHVLDICRGITERGYDLNIWAYARVDTVRDEAMLAALARAGCRWLAFGIEAGTGKVRDDVAKGFAQEAIFTGLERVRAAGISIGANYIFGLPEDDLVSMQATLALALDLNAEYANFYAAMAYPGSALYAKAAREGWPLPASWGGYAQYAEDTLPLPTKFLPASEVLRFRDMAFNRYYQNPAYLAMIAKRFGQATVAEIREMATAQLKRRSPEGRSLAAAGTHSSA